MSTSGEELVQLVEHLGLRLIARVRPGSVLHFYSMSITAATSKASMVLVSGSMSVGGCSRARSVAFPPIVAVRRSKMQRATWLAQFQLAACPVPINFINVVLLPHQLRPVS